MANESNVPQAQSVEPVSAEAVPPASENSPSNLSPAELIDGLDLASLQAAAERIAPDREAGMEGVDAGEQPQQQTEQPPAAAEARTEEEEPPPATPSADADDDKPGRIRIDKITDERTRAILAFQSRNHDATIEDAIAFVDGQAGNAAPAAPVPAPTTPDLTAIQSEIADLTTQIKAKGNPLGDDYDGDAVEDLREQRENLRVELRFAQEKATAQQASAYQQRVEARQTSATAAVEMCPEINDPNSPQGKEFARLYSQYEARKDPILQNDEVPELIALKVMRATGYVAKPKADPAAPGAATPTTPASTPSKSSPPAPVAPRSTVPMARPNPPVQATAPGNARLTPASTPSPAQLMEALRDSDLGTLEEITAQAGKKLQPSPLPYSLA